ncbi:hypothetical protein [Pedobacter antarcticus]|uniref:hypothetical protein n=1 Tax=Pedobacter antarcticus TaxID=34086 RepID=UPI002930FC91|nr:hypothetical protein [Pedobacter antarcticus]
MRKLIAASIITLICGCSTIKKTTQETESISQSSSGSQNSSEQLDSTKRLVTEKWKITGNGNLPSFMPWILPELKGATDQQKQALEAMQAQINSQAKNHPDQQGWTMEFEKSLLEALGQYKLEKSTDTSSNSASHKEDLIIKEPVSPWYMPFVYPLITVLVFQILMYLFKKLTGKS